MGIGARLAGYVTERAGQVWTKIAPGDASWRGAAWGLLIGTFLLFTFKLVTILDGSGLPIILLLGIPAALVGAAGGGLLLLVIVRLLVALPAFFRVVLASSLFILLMRVFTGPLQERLVPSLYVMLACSAAGAGAASIARWRVRRPSRLRQVLVLVAAVNGAGAILYGALWLFGAGGDNKPAIDAAKETGIAVPQLTEPDPSRPGSYRVLRLFYGSGNDRRRPEYGSGVALVTKPVDGSSFVHGWQGIEATGRRRYWGFDATTMPINGRVWYPEGDGPFPLVLVVHGGHPMQEFSDPGYDYLGEHLASHGFILVSVDENFLNPGPWQEFGGLTGDNAARGWLLLQHLSAFRAWSRTAGNPFTGKVDLDRVALMGHSRGGEAITAAWTFNHLDRSPDDATLKFDFGFGIRALVAISTTDRQYLPGGKATQIENTSYLALQGSNDGDVDSFEGAQQYERVRFTRPDEAPELPIFKAAVYIHRASHGQFNRSWGRHDKSSFPRSSYFNRKPVLPAAEQERVAQAYITSFLRATLLGQRGYVPFLQDHRTGAAWLPETIYVNRYLSSRARLFCTFDDDLDATTAGPEGGRIEGENLTVWREQPVGAAAARQGNESRAAFVGWDHDAIGAMPSYAVSLPPGATADARSSLVFALADANEGSNPRRLMRRGAHGQRRPPAGNEPRRPIDLTIEIADASGNVARLPLSSVSLLQPQLEARVWKGWFVERRAPEIVFQTFALPLQRFVAVNQALDPTKIARVRFVFDKTPAGVVVLDDLGIQPGE